jgi:hypothetical protein
MEHSQNIERYPGTLAELATELGNLRYDALAVFLHAFSEKLAADGRADGNRGRRKLSAALHDGAAKISAAAEDVERAWAICAPHM